MCWKKWLAAIEQKDIPTMMLIEKEWIPEIFYQELTERNELLQSQVEMLQGKLNHVEMHPKYTPLFSDGIENANTLTLKDLKEEFKDLKETQKQMNVLLADLKKKIPISSLQNI